jgi:uncharacterized protein
MDLRAKLARLRNASAMAQAASEAMQAATALQVDGDKAERVAQLQAASALQQPHENHNDHAKSARIAQLRALIGEVAARDRRRAPPQPRPGPRLLPWSSVPTPHGPLHTVERWLEPDHHHGSAPVQGGLFSQPGTLAALIRDAALGPLDLSRALYLDTETTGLAGGTGTVAFLIGLARFDDGVLVIEQLVVPELGAEAPVLGRLAERIAAASCVITYNGKSFDWPLLRTRFVLSRMQPPALPCHIDLLHVSRSLWKPRMATLRLRDVEREILAFERHDDIDGAEIPERYFEYLRGESADRLVPVLEHNQNDLIALAALLGVMIARFEDLASHPDSRDTLAFGKVALRVRDEQRAQAFAQAALAAGACPSHPADFAQRAFLFASEVSRQQGDDTRTLALLEQALSVAHEPQPRAAIHLTLAKLYEHEHASFAAALRHARHTEPVEGPHAHGRRLGRLYRRLLQPSRVRGVA